MDGIKTVVADGGRVVLPASLRKALGLSIGDEVMITLEEDSLRITSLAKAVTRAQALVGRYVKRGRSLSSELLKERRRESRRG